MLPLVKHNYAFSGGIVNFFKRRAIRILPPYYLSVCFSLFLIWFFIGDKTGTHWDVSLPVKEQVIFTHLFLIHDFFSSHIFRINHVLWSISVESRIYLLFPALIFIWKRYGIAITILTGLFSCIAMYYLLIICNSFYTDINTGFAGVNPYILLFIFGMVAAAVTTSGDKSKSSFLNYSWTLILVITVLIFVLFKLFSRTYLADHFVLSDKITDILFGLVSSALIIYCFKRELVYKKSVLFSWRPVVFLGSFAYSVYLFHAPLLQLLTQYALSPLHLSSYSSVLILMIPGTAVILGIIYVLFLFCELPFLNLLKTSSKSATGIETVKSPAP